VRIHECASRVHKLIALVSGPLYCIKYSHGNIADSITLTGGIAVDRPRPGMGVGIGAAGAFMASMRTLAVDMAPLRFNCIMPGLVDTELLDVRLTLSEISPTRR
jgi:NAD(P)-dependent dehydrogenase (short-subunit alcohol dehydrogenase family)